jgi:hypothetical protein
MHVLLVSAFVSAACLLVLVGHYGVTLLLLVCC